MPLGKFGLPISSLSGLTVELRNGERVALDSICNRSNGFPFLRTGVGHDTTTHADYYTSISIPEVRTDGSANL